MKKIDLVELYYFSGTGNTYLLAKAMQSEFMSMTISCELKQMSTKKVVINNNSLVGLIFPVAIQATYPNVFAFIKRLPKTNGTPIFMADTLNKFSGGIVGVLKHMLKRKGYMCVAAKEFKMANSMNTKPILNKIVLQKNNEALTQARAYARDILENKVSWKSHYILSLIMNSFSKPKLMWKLTAKMLVIDDSKCTKCSLCINNCPTNSLSMKENKVVKNNNTCISCMRCANFCPSNSFLLNKKPLVQKKVVNVRELSSR